MGHSVGQQLVKDISGFTKAVEETPRKKSKIETMGGIAVLVSIIVGGICFWITKNIAIAFIPVLVGLGIWFLAGMKAEADIKQRANLHNIMTQLEQQVELILKDPTLSHQQDHCAKAISLLKRLHTPKLHSDHATPLEQFLNSLFTLHKVLPVAEMLDHAERVEQKGQREEAINCYFDVLVQFKKGELGDADFAATELKNDRSGETITRDYIEEKLKSLGWKGR